MFLLKVLVFGRLKAEESRYLPELPKDRYRHSGETRDSLAVIILKLALLSFAYGLEIGIALVSYGEREVEDAFLSRRSARSPLDRFHARV